MHALHDRQAVRTMQMAYAIADRDAVSCIETQCTPVLLEGQAVPWLDTTAMVSEHEHAPQALDINREVLLYAHFRHLIVHHEPLQHLVRLTTSLTRCKQL